MRCSARSHISQLHPGTVPAAAHPELQSEVTPRFFPSRPPVDLISWACDSRGPPGRWTKQTKEGLYLDARSPNRLSGSEEQKKQQDRVQNGRKEKRHSFTALPPCLRKPKEHVPPAHPCAAAVSSRALRSRLVCRPLGPAIFICRN